MEKRFLSINALLASVLGLWVAAIAHGQTTATAHPERRTTELGTGSEQLFLAKITVSDLSKSYEFYTQVIGLHWATSPNQPPPKPPSPEDPPVDFREIPLNFSGSLADPILVLVQRRGIEPLPQSARLTTIGFKVPSARDVVSRAVAAGYETIGHEPDEGPMTFGFVSDPDGYTVELIQAPSYGENE